MDSTVDKMAFFLLLITRSGHFDCINYIIPSFSSEDGNRIIKKPELIPFLPSKFSQKGKRGGAPFPLHYIYWTSRHQSWLNVKKKPKKLFFSKLVDLLSTVYKTVYTCITPSKHAKPKSMLYIPPSKEITRQPQIQARRSVYHQPPPTPTWLLFHHVLAHNPEVTKSYPKNNEICIRNQVMWIHQVIKNYSAIYLFIYHIYSTHSRAQGAPYLPFFFFSFFLKMWFEWNLTPKTANHTWTNIYWNVQGSHPSELSCKKPCFTQEKGAFTSSCLNNCLAVDADTIMRRAAGDIKPSSTALSIKDSSEL